jgi:hypothetical protein
VIIEYSSVDCLDPVADFCCPYLFCCWVQTVIQFEKLCTVQFFNSKSRIVLDNFMAFMGSSGAVVGT